MQGYQIKARNRDSNHTLNKTSYVFSSSEKGLDAHNCLKYQIHYNKSLKKLVKEASFVIVFSHISSK